MINLEDIFHGDFFLLWFPCYFTPYLLSLILSFFWGAITKKYRNFLCAIFIVVTSSWEFLLENFFGVFLSKIFLKLNFIHNELQFRLPIYFTKREDHSADQSQLGCISNRVLGRSHLQQFNWSLWVLLFSTMDIKSHKKIQNN